MKTGLKSNCLSLVHRTFASQSAQEEAPAPNDKPHPVLEAMAALTRDGTPNQALELCLQVLGNDSLPEPVLEDILDLMARICRDFEDILPPSVKKRSHRRLYKTDPNSPALALAA